MSKIIGVTVGTPISPQSIKEKINPVTSVNGIKADENGNVDIPGGSGGGVDFKTDETLNLENGVLSVNTVDEVIEDSTMPITSGAVYGEFSKAVALLKTI